MFLDMTRSLIVRGNYAPTSTRTGSLKLLFTASRALFKEEAVTTDTKHLAEVVKEVNKQDPESMEKVTDAAEAVKDGAKEVRKTSEFIRDTTKAAADTITKASKTVTDKVIDVAENATGTPQGTVQATLGAVKKIKESIVGKE